MSDRTVHAECSTFEIVRYDRTGKWYREWRDGFPRMHLSVGQAARDALVCVAREGGAVHYGLPGGRVFDRRVRSRS